MCGIYSYVGNKPCRQFVLDGLTRMEYRGYDSAGIACIDAKSKRISFQKEVGGISLLKKIVETKKFDGFVGMGHIRWATTGIVDQKNAHPQFNCDKTIAVVHNGIIERHEEVKERLIQGGHVFVSSTDTETIAHLFEDLLEAHHDVKQAACGLLSSLHGAFSVIIMMEKYPDQLIVIRRRSPLAIGIGDGEMYVASDYLAFSDKTSEVVFLPDDTFALISASVVSLFDIKGRAVPLKVQKVEPALVDIDKKEFEHYMLKEIYEQKRAIGRTISFLKIIGSQAPTVPDDEVRSSQVISNDEYASGIWRQLGMTAKEVKQLRSLNLIAAGTSWHAARIAQFFFESLCRIPARVYLASEYSQMPFFKEESSVYLCISQSGETADTLQALREISKHEVCTIALSNFASSTMVRESLGFLPMQAGPEISVASTKTFSTQLATLYWLANRIALEKGLISVAQMHEAEEDLYITAELLETMIETYKLSITQGLAKKYAQYNRFIFLGRHISYPFAMEAALKLKEISYIFSQCYPAGELKHGPIALIDEHTPVVLFSTSDEFVYSKLLSNAHEVKARNGHLVVFAFEGQQELINLADTVFVIPKVKPLMGPLAMTGLMQFFVYQITRELNRPIDKPRNLAKSVTVE